MYNITPTCACFNWRGCGRDRHVRLTSYTSIIYEIYSGLVEKDCLFTFFSWTERVCTWHTHKPYWKVSRDYEKFWISYEYWKVWSNYDIYWPEFVSSVRMQLLIWLVQIVFLWSRFDFPSHNHVLFMMLKGIFWSMLTNEKWNPKFEFLHDFFWNFQTKLAGHGANVIWHVTMYPCG